MERWIVAGKALKNFAKPGETLASTTAGAIPYYSDLNTIDMLGLNNIYIAHQPSEHMGIGAAGHEKGDAKYILSLKPDYMVFLPCITKYPLTDLNKTLAWARAWVEKDLAKMPEFLNNYEVVPIPLENGLWFNIYRRKNRGQK